MVESKPNVVDTDCESWMVSCEESRSGMCRPWTWAGPSALTTSAATHDESMPPDSATTRPRRLSSWLTMRRISAQIRSASAARSMLSTSAENAISAPLLADHECGDVVHRVEVLGHQ